MVCENYKKFKNILKRLGVKKELKQKNICLLELFFTFSDGLDSTSMQKIALQSTKDAFSSMLHGTDIYDDIAEKVFYAYTLNHVENYGKVKLDDSLIEFAQSIKYDNNKVRKVADFIKQEVYSQDFMKKFSKKIGIEEDRIDYVLFSAASGAEEHVDKLDPNIFGEDTYLIPIIATKRSVFLNANHSMGIQLKVGNIYKFNHQKKHSLQVNDNDGCVLIMAAIKHKNIVDQDTLFDTNIEKPTKAHHSADSYFKDIGISDIVHDDKIGNGIVTHIDRTSEDETRGIIISFPKENKRIEYNFNGISIHAGKVVQTLFYGESSTFEIISNQDRINNYFVHAEVGNIVYDPKYGKGLIERLSFNQILVMFKQDQDAEYDSNGNEKDRADDNQHLFYSIDDFERYDNGDL